MPHARAVNFVAQPIKRGRVAILLPRRLISVMAIGQVAGFSLVSCFMFFGLFYSESVRFGRSRKTGSVSLFRAVRIRATLNLVPLGSGQSTEIRYGSFGCLPLRFFRQSESERLRFPSARSR